MRVEDGCDAGYNGTKDEIKKVLEKLNDKQLNYCITLSTVMSIDKMRAEKKKCLEYSAKLRGFLDCLLQMGSINVSEMKLIHSYFISEGRRK